MPVKTADVTKNFQNFLPRSDKFDIVKIVSKCK